MIELVSNGQPLPPASNPFFVLFDPFVFFVSFVFQSNDANATFGEGGTG